MLPELHIDFPRPTPRNMGAVFVDVETTGLSPVRDQMIDIAIIKDGDIPWSTKIALDKWGIERASPKALELVGFRESEWRDAPVLGDVIEEIAKRIAGNVIIGHNVEFDIRFISNALDGCGIRPAQVIGPRIDTLHLAKLALKSKGLSKFSLKACCEYFGIPPEGEHRAMGGASRCRELFWRILGHVPSVSHGQTVV